MNGKLNFLIRKVFGIFLGSTVFMASQFLIIVVLAKLGSPREVGEFGLAVAITGPIYMFFSMQLRSMYVTDRDKKYKFIDYMSLCLVNATIALVVTVLCVLNKPSEMVLLVLLYSIAKFLQTLGEIVYGKMQREEKLVLVGVSNCLKGIVSLFFFSIIFYITRELVLATLGIVISWFLVLYLYDLPRSNLERTTQLFKGLMNIKFHNMKNLWMLALPLGLISLLYSFNTNITRYFVTYYFDETALGYFTACAYLMMIGNTFIGAVGQTLSSRMATYYNISTSNKKFNKLLISMVLFGLLIGVLTTILTSLLGSDILTIFYGSEYSHYSILLTLLMSATIIRYPAEFIGYATIASRTYKFEVPMLIIMLISSVISSWKLIPLMGLNGAAFSILLSSLIAAIGRVVIIIRANKLKASGKIYEQNKHIS
ncbi:oligosaccharide flippase family protein [Priestia megaterium]|uniref:oligosaccharide flippase family protein n=1 Tax=Priestia megaterium TaxID=1404 RepID=UPI00207A824F|nr:oligosaccharide flippase family protein [Priestia megaterium]USL43541.1 oligosaccharide flippase family protein [Priestia megaterium]